MSGLRVCMVTTFYPPHSFGGDGIAVQALSRALARRGHQVSVICDEDAYRTLRVGDVAPATVESDGVTVHRLRSRVGPLSLLLTQQSGRPLVHGRAIRRILAEGEFDVVHFHNVSLVGGPAVLGYPDALTLYTAHEHWLVCPMHVLWKNRREPCDSKDCLRCSLAHRRPPQLWRDSAWYERQLGQVDAFIAQSEFSRRKHIEFGFPFSMELLPPFLPDRERPAPRADGSDRARPYFLYVGRLEPLKGLDDVIPLFAHGDGPDLVIAGEGSSREELTRLAGGSARVRFVGWQSREQLDVLYAGAVGAIVPSIGYETFGLTVIEAFSRGVPVLARRSGPLPELIDGCGAGETFTTADELRVALARLLDDPSRRAMQGQVGYEGFSVRYSESAVVPQYLALLERVARARGNHRVLAALGATAEAA